MPDNRKTSLGIQLTDGSICELIPPAPDATYRGGVTLEEKTKYDNYEGEINEIKEDIDDLSIVFTQYITSNLYRVDNSYWCARYTRAPLENHRAYATIDLPKGIYYYRGIYAYFTWIIYPDDTTLHLSNDVNSKKDGYFILTEDARISITTKMEVENPILTNDINLFNGIIPYYEGTRYGLNNNDIPLTKTAIITVKKDGSEGFKTLREATEFIDNMYGFDKYEIHIYSGTYDLYNELGGNTWYSSITNTEPSNRLGIQIKDNVSLIGHGDVFLKLEAPDDLANINNTSRVSALEVYGNSRIENVHITTKNTRYCIHDETGGLLYKNAVHKYKNVYAEHKGNKSGTWLYNSCIASGSSSGNKYYYENCVFKSTISYGFSFHNNAGQEGNTIVLDGCDIVGNFNGGSVKFGYYGDNTNDTNIFIKNCICNNKIYVNPETNTGTNDNVFKVHNFTNIEVEIN